MVVAIESAPVLFFFYSRPFLHPLGYLQPLTNLGLSADPQLSTTSIDGFILIPDAPKLGTASTTFNLGGKPGPFCGKFRSGPAPSTGQRFGFGISRIKQERRKNNEVSRIHTREF